MFPTPADVFAAAALLSLERLCYAWASRQPEQFRSMCARWPRSTMADPVSTLSVLFVAFKAIQLAVFTLWCAPDFSRWALGAATPVLALGVGMVGVGQALNLGVFARLGRTGVFYGSRFGHRAPWRRGFPFSLMPHPQYTGAVMSIWGVFMLLRAPAPDWYVLPVIETLYYAASAYVER